MVNGELNSGVVVVLNELIDLLNKRWWVLC